jgi:hypothetical protein
VRCPQLANLLVGPAAAGGSGARAPRVKRPPRSPEPHRQPRSLQAIRPLDPGASAPLLGTYRQPCAGARHINDRPPSTSDSPPKREESPIYRPGELVQCDLWEPREPVPVGYGQTRRGWVVTAELCWSRVIAGALVFSKEAPDSLWGVGCCLERIGGAARAAGVGPRERDRRRWAAERSSPRGHLSARVRCYRAVLRLAACLAAVDTPAQPLSADVLRSGDPDICPFLLGHRDATVTRVVYIHEIADARRRHMRRSRMTAEYAGALRIVLGTEEDDVAG